jgi:hypothetical protein
MSDVQQSILRMLLTRPLHPHDIRQNFFGSAGQGNALAVVEKMIAKGLLVKNRNGYVELTPEGYKAAAPARLEVRPHVPYVPPTYIRRRGSLKASSLPSLFAGKSVSPVVNPKEKNDVPD